MAPNCVVFAIMDSIYFRPLPYPDQPRLALLNFVHPTNAGLDEVDAFTFGEWQARLSSVQSMAAYRTAAFIVNEGDRPERMTGQLVTPAFFHTLGLLPAMGRTFRAEDCQPGASPVVVVSHGTWAGYFSKRADIVGLAIRLDGAPATVVGVMPSEFTSFMEGRAARVWAPMTLESTAAPGPVRAGNAIGRLKSGATLERVRLELASIDSGLARQFPAFYADRRSSARDFRGALFGGLGPGLRMLSVVVGLLLLIACANAANLLLGRSVERSREVAIRKALGARRWQLLGAMLAEHLVLAAGAALVGLLLAYWGTQLLWAWTAPIFRVIGVEAIVFDQRVLVFAALLTAVTTVLFGVLPALRGSRTDIVSVLKQSAPTSGRRGTRRMSAALVIGQVALCVVTMIGTTLVLRSFLHFSQLSANPGFRVEGLLVATLPKPGPLSPSQAARLRTVTETEKRIRALPGVERVAVTASVPFLETGVPATLFRRAPVAGDDRAGQRVDAQVRVVDGNFFDVMAVPLLKGRTFTPGDDEGSLPVVVLSERMARAYWNGADPIGDRLLMDGTWRTVVGLVGSSIRPSLFNSSAREVFVPYLQAPPSDAKLLVRSALPPATLAGLVREQVRSVDADQPVADLQTMEQALDATMTPFRLILVLMALFGGIAVALAAVGLYGVMAHDVSRRTREIGVRLALGASRADVLKLVVRQGLRLAAVGLVLGLLLGAAVGKVLPSELLGVEGLSLPHYAAAMVLWLAAALVACLLPARKAAAVDPLPALRSE